MADPTTPSPSTPSLSVTSLEARIAVLEGKAKTDASKAWAWIKGNWLHGVTWAAVIVAKVKGWL